MLVLFDNGTPRTLARYLIGHHTIVTTDRNLRYQQNLDNRKLAIVVLGRGRWTIIRSHIAKVVAAVDAATPGSFTEVEMREET
jgi:hypothetical protein